MRQIEKHVSETCIDVTGLITTGQTLDAVNPNTLFIANDGVLTNTKNVIVSGTCANLELVDGKPFNTPVAFTASKATYNLESLSRIEELYEEVLGE